MPRVLIVDDHVENLYVLRVLLAAHGWQIDEAQNGIEALQKARQQLPQLVISDLLMPVMDGYTLLKTWKTDQQLKSVPFIVYTATYTDTNDEKLAMDMGADAFIVKPAEPEAFIKRISQIINMDGTVLHTPLRQPLGDESTQMKQYNESLIRKLEQKMLQLEQTNIALEQDIAQRKKLEAEREMLQSQLVQAQKMESIGRLAGSIAHDFNNLIGVIMGYADAALQIAKDSDPVRADLLEIRKAAQRSSAITSQLLMFARMRPGTRQPIKLNEAIDDMIVMLRQLVGRNIELAWLPGREVDTVLMDPAHVTQVLTNLFTNGRDAITRDAANATGKITITTTRVKTANVIRTRYGDMDPGEYICLSVRDTGCGMSAGTLSHLFEPFFTTKSIGKGTGLGLATIYGIIQQNNGFVNVSSEPGKGTTFELYFSPYEVTSAASSVN
jgi:signal transduction histidine kinase